jgi:predicted phage terminase large subunit-like protein
LAKSPYCRFIHTSSGKDLVLENSSNTKNTILTEEYQTFWPLKLQEDSRSKSKWYVQHHGGGMLAVQSGGQLTGFRAGRMGYDAFSGAILFDDPLKPEDANYALARNRINDRYNETVRSRLATEQTPVIVIMQRVHNDDLSAYLLKGGSGEQWYHLELPAEINENRSYPSEFEYGIQIPHELEPGPLWTYKHTQDDLNLMKSSAKTKYTYAAQYDQRPNVKGGSIFNSNWWTYYESFDSSLNQITLESGMKVNLIYKNVYADTAQKIKEIHDFSVFQLWGRGVDGRIYLLDQIRARFEAPDLEKQFLRFLKKHEFNAPFNMMGIRHRKVEDKSSGTGLIQAIRRKGISIDGIPRNRDKVSRANDGAPRIEEGLLVLPKDAHWTYDYVKEFSDFSPLMTHEHDDQIDATLDAINDMLIGTEDYIDYDLAYNQETKYPDEELEVVGL